MTTGRNSRDPEGTRRNSAERIAVAGSRSNLRCWLRRAWLVAAWVVALFVSNAAAAQQQIDQPDTVRIAVIGDYGDGSQAAADVAALVKGWNPDLVVTTGDNNYPDGAAATIDANVGRFYHEFIAPYTGQHGPGADVNRFFPTLGNHDWNARQGVGMPPQPYIDYFTLPDGPGQERYYDVVWGPVHLFAVDSDYREPHGTEAGTAQWRWLQQRLAESTAPWKLVVMHEAPYSSGLHGSTVRLRWPFQEWSATAVLSGHDHAYERVVDDGFPYFVNGLGGDSRYWFLLPVSGSQVRYNADSGAMLVEATPQDITFRFITRRGDEIDAYRIAHGSPAAPAPRSPGVPRRRGPPKPPAPAVPACPRPTPPQSNEFAPC